MSATFASLATFDVGKMPTLGGDSGTRLRAAVRSATNTVFSHAVHEFAPLVATAIDEAKAAAAPSSAAPATGEEGMAEP